jgi:hypothetical protein
MAYCGLLFVIDREGGTIGVVFSVCLSCGTRVMLMWLISLLGLLNIVFLPFFLMNKGVTLKVYK